MRLWSISKSGININTGSKWFSFSVLRYNRGHLPYWYIMIGLFGWVWDKHAYDEDQVKDRRKAR